MNFLGQWFRIHSQVSSKRRRGGDHHGSQQRRRRRRHNSVLPDLQQPTRPVPATDRRRSQGRRGPEPPVHLQHVPKHPVPGRLTGHEVGATVHPARRDQDFGVPTHLQHHLALR